MIQYLCPLLPAPWIKWGEGQGVPLGLVFKASEAENPARPCHQWPGLGLLRQALDELPPMCHPATHLLFLLATSQAQKMPL